MNSNDSKKQPDNEADKAGDASTRRWLLTDLLGGAREVVIEHGSDTYRLRLTSKNKLILTK